MNLKPSGMDIFKNNMKSIENFWKKVYKDHLDNLSLRTQRMRSKYESHLIVK